MMDQELLMKQIVEQVMQAMKNGAPAASPAAPAGGKVTSADYPLAENMAKNSMAKAEAIIRFGR